MKQIIKKIIASWANAEGSVNKTEELFDWIHTLNNTTAVDIQRTSVNEDSFWFYDDYRGEILNRKRSFFSITGIRYFKNEEFVSEQPIIIQQEIGYLGIIIKEINGVIHFLMQAKIEPGNVNCVQISPTIQATKSNFTRAHGGRLPLFFDYFEHASQKGTIIYDQIQSEQGSRFLGKRNRNLILLVEDDIPEHPNYKWMTLGQIKEFMKHDNLVNMDTRTVLSGIPLMTCQWSEEDKAELDRFFTDKAFMNSLFYTNVSEKLPRMTALLNDYKMFTDVEHTLIPLNQLVEWKVDDYGVTSRKNADFSVSYYDINISGREVQHWLQPLFKAESKALFVLLTRIQDGKREFLISLAPEVGTFDKVEFGPSLQIANTAHASETNSLYKLTCEYLKAQKGILIDVILSEEGGRFYHEQNRNVILDITGNSSADNIAQTIWVDYASLNYLIQANNCLNIQLRNLLSLLDI